MQEQSYAPKRPGITRFESLLEDQQASSERKKVTIAALIEDYRDRYVLRKRTEPGRDQNAAG